MANKTIQELNSLTESAYDDTLAVYDTSANGTGKLTIGNITSMAMNNLGVKNLIPYPYYEGTETDVGITWTDNGDGTITANGTATATSHHMLWARLSGVFPNIIAGQRYVLSLEVQNGTCSVYFSHTVGTTNKGEFAVRNVSNGYAEVEFTAWEDEYDGNNLGLYIGTSTGQQVNTIIKPMLRLASNLDNTWMPYAATNTTLTKQIGTTDIASISDGTITGAIDALNTFNNLTGIKNLIPYPYNYSTETISGVTFTDNGDGTITANGTATANISFSLKGWTIEKGAIPLNSKYRYILSGCPEGGSSSTYAVSARFYPEGVTPSSGSGNTGRDYGEGYKTNNEYVYASPYISIWNGTTVSNLTFKPMLRVASDTDSTWQPYAPSNKEINTLLTQLPISHGGTGATSFSQARQNLGITRALLGANDDLNDINSADKVGFYQITPGVINAPIDAWSWLLVIAGAGTLSATQQVLFHGPMIYSRSYVGNPPSWTSWRSIQLFEPNQKMFIKKSYSAAYTLAANASVGLYNAQFKFNTPTGYTPLSFNRVSSGLNNVLLRQVTTEGVVLTNLSNSTVNGTCTLELLYVKNFYV